MARTTDRQRNTRSPRQARRQLNKLLRDPIAKPHNAAAVRIRLDEMMADSPTSRVPSKAAKFNQSSQYTWAGSV